MYPKRYRDSYSCAGALPLQLYVAIAIWGTAPKAALQPIAARGIHNVATATGETSVSNEWLQRSAAIPHPLAI